MDDKELHEKCLEWAHWCHTRKYFAPPVPQNILAQFQAKKRATKEPDGPLSAYLAFLNMAIHGLHDQFPEEGICFNLYYFYQFRPVKAIWRALDIGERTFYDRLHRFARRALKLSKTIKQIHTANIADISAENNSAVF